LLPAAVVPGAIVLAPFVYVAATKSLVERFTHLCGPEGLYCKSLQAASWKDLLLGVGPRTLGESGLPAVALDPEAVSTHVRLLVENGVLGWVAILWVLVAAMVTLYRAHRHATDPNLRALLWAVFCSVAGFMITLTRFCAFENLTLQVFFWGLLGIGMGAAVRLGPRRREYAIVLKLGH
jgi:hypothetical protein